MGQFITSQSEDYSQWYNDIIEHAGLAEHSGVRGCMVIKPNGYAIWEIMQQVLDKSFKATGHRNAYFPLFVPKSLFEAEEKNAEGFAKECAVVTHYRLKNDPDHVGKLMVDPEAKLEEELIVRPTSEAIIWNTYKRWVQSYRDLPILLNQWANVVRWEMRTRLFLRTAEFLWQEGHTAHATRLEAEEEAETMLNVYAEFAEQTMAIPVIRGRKTESERFAGAEDTLCIEAMMQDGKALQAGTSHFLGQNFAKAFDVQFQNAEGKREYVWATSWGVSTRLMGALIMTHSDNKGLVIPPKIAPYKVVFIPIFRNEEQGRAVRETIDHLQNLLSKKHIDSLVDNDMKSPLGKRFGKYEMEGIPLRIAVGSRDIENNSFSLVRRDSGESIACTLENSLENILTALDAMQEDLLQKAKHRLETNTREVNTWEEFTETLEKESGFLSAHWDGTAETEAKIQELTKASIRCIPLNNPLEKGSCILTGNPSTQRVIFAKAY